MSIDVSDGQYRPPLRRRAPDQAPELPADAADALAREQAEEDAVFLVSSRARLAAEQARALREGAAKARETGGAGFAASFIDGYRTQAADIAAKAASAGGGQARPSDEAVAAFRAGTAADADALIDRAAMAETVARAEKRQREGAAALDAIRQQVFDDPDGFAAAQARLDEAIEALAPILDPDAPDRRRSEERARLAASAVQGRIASAPGIALRELDDPERFKALPEARRASLREAAGRRRAAAVRDAELAAELATGQDALRRAEADRDFTTGFFTRAAQGEARDAELEEAVDRGVITPNRANTLRDARDTENARRAAQAEGLATLQELIDSGARPDPANPLHIDSIGAYWKQVVLPALRQQGPADLPSFIAAISRSIGFVPEDAGSAVRAFWDSGDPERRIAAARTLRQISLEGDPEAPGPFLALFDPRESAVQRRALDFVDIGLSPEDAIARAEDLIPLDVQSDPLATPVTSGTGEPEAGRREQGASNSVSRDTPVSGDSHGPNSDDGQPRGEQTAESASGVPAQLAQGAGEDNPLRLPPEAEKEAASNFERILTDGVQGLDRGQRINVLKSLWRSSGDLTEDERKVVGEIYGSMSLDKAFMDLDAVKRAEFLEKFKNDPVIQSTDPRRWSSLSHEQKLAIFNRVVELQSKVYGYPKPKVALRDLGNEAAAGEFDERTETIVINPERDDFVDQMPATLGTLAHEALHAYQWKLKQEFAAGKIPPSDPRYQWVELLTLNSGALSFRGAAGHIYYVQPSERHSRNVGAAIQDMVTEDLNRRVRGAGRP